MTHAFGDRAAGRGAAPVTLFIVDDHGLLRSVMALAMRALTGIEVVGQADNGRTAVDEVTKLQPDIVLMDIVMPLLDGLEATRRIRKQSPKTRVVVLTAAAQPELVLDVLRAGAIGLVSKSADLAELERAIQAAVRGEIYISPELAGPVLASMAMEAAALQTDDLNGLSTREREIIQLIGEGQSTQEIADGLVISPKTVAQHKSNIVKKLRLSGTRDLSLYAARRMLAQQTH